jgi:hypothetical protein
MNPMYTKPLELPRYYDSSENLMKRLKAHAE